jgi:inorganic triphosphatase YgiF
MAATNWFPKRNTVSFTMATRNSHQISNDSNQANEHTYEDSHRNAIKVANLFTNHSSNHCTNKEPYKLSYLFTHQEPHRTSYVATNQQAYQGAHQSTN